MKAKTIITITVILVLLYVLSGCGIKGVSETQLIDDINSCEEIQNIFTSDFISESKYTVTKCDIVKEQANLDEKEDLIYCEITIENDYFAIELNVKTVYNYYDKGGWMLDEATFDKTEVYVKKAPDSYDDISSFIYYNTSNFYAYKNNSLAFYTKDDKLEYYDLAGGDLSVTDCVLNSDDPKYATVICVYQSDCINAKGTYELLFDDNEGWIIPDGPMKDDHILLTEYSSDFSKAEGVFLWTEDDMYIILSIKDITDEYVIYSVTSDSDETIKGWVKGGQIKMKFDSISGRFYFLDSDAANSLTYNPENDVWFDSTLDLIFERMN